jgi:hypothetical protein
MVTRLVSSTAHVHEQSEKVATVTHIAPSPIIGSVDRVPMRYLRPRSAGLDRACSLHGEGINHLGKTTEWSLT